MTRTLMLAGVLVGGLSSVTLAEELKPVQLTGAQMDTVTAGADPQGVPPGTAGFGKLTASLNGGTAGANGLGKRNSGEAGNSEAAGIGLITAGFAGE